MAVGYHLAQRRITYLLDADWWRPSWHARPWRPVWTGYTPEQRRIIRDGNKPAAVSHKELV